MRFRLGRTLTRIWWGGDRFSGLRGYFPGRFGPSRGLFDHRIPRARGGTVALGPAGAFSRGSGRGRRGAQLEQKAQRAALHQTRRQGFRCRTRPPPIPGWAVVGHVLPQQQQLPVGQRTQPHPEFRAMRLGGLVGIQAQVLLEETEGMFQSKAPQVHPAQVLERYRPGAGPEQPQRALVAGCAIGLEELHPQDHAHQGGELVEVQPVPGAQADLLAEQGELLLAVGGATRLRQLELGAVFARRAFAPRRLRPRLLVEHDVVAQPHQRRHRGHDQEHGQEDHVAVQAVRHDDFGPGAALVQRLDLGHRRFAVGAGTRHPAHVLGGHPGGADRHQAGQPGILVADLDGLVFTLLPLAAVRQCLRIGALVGGGVHGVDLVAGQGVAVARLRRVEHLGQLLGVQRRFFQHVVDPAELAPEERLFTQRDRRPDVSSHGQGVEQIQGGIWPPAQAGVHGLAELL